VAQPKLAWQSKLVLLAVLPYVAADIVLEVHWWAINARELAIWTIGLSLLLGLVAWQTRSATAGAALAGAAITACLMFSSAVVPYQPWNTALIPVAALLLLTSISTRVGRARKERLGLAEKRVGRSASQVAANLGVSALASCAVAQTWIMNSAWFSPGPIAQVLVFAPMLAALAESAADTVSSEIGQVLGGRPLMITTLRRVEPGTNGAISLAGTLAGFLAAAVVAASGAIALRGGMAMFSLGCAGGVFGLFFDSLLGATLERRGWLNNDLVNFLSTASASAFSLGLMALLPHRVIA
jgi:uncharacterized protein (TIGR00297 family)